MISTTFTSGKEQTVSIIGQKEWSSSSNAQQRIYFELEHSGDARKGIDKLYRVIAGDVGRDIMIADNGAIYGFSYAIGVDSKTKKAAVAAAVLDIVKQL